MAKVKRNVLIDEIDINLFVRKALDQDRVLYFAELIGQNVQLPLVTLATVATDPDNKLVVVDGRHRIDAYRFQSIPSIDAEIITVANEIELIAEAYRANVGGALPPTKGDTEHTIRLLLERGESKRRIASLLDLPTAIANKYVNTVLSQVTRARVTKALDAMENDSLSAPQAAEKYKVDFTSLKSAFSSRRKTNKKSLTNMGQVKRDITAAYRSLSQRIAFSMRKLTTLHDDGDVNDKQIKQIIKQIETCQRNSTRNMENWKKRFSAKECVS